MKHLLLLFLLACAGQAFAQSSQIPLGPSSGVGVDTLMIQTVYTDIKGVEHARPVKTQRIVSSSGRSGTTTMYYSLDPAVLDSHVRKRILTESPK